jgi:cell division protein FtsZ
MKETITFDMPKNQSSIIKVIGVGGGGSNAVNHMYRQGIKGVDFVICNTDVQAMEISPVPVKIQMGEKGLGAGSVPAVGREAALKKTEEIRDILEKNTKMLFITAGMGGGTGTGAAPVIASIARELDILTVGIVTLPFSFEGRKRKLQAEEGIIELKQYVDTLLIISNDKLREVCGDLKLSDAFHKADDVLSTAAKGIAEIITVPGYINVDFEDVKTVMLNSGRAIMGSARAEGQNRAMEAVKAALSSPLLNDSEIEGAGNVLLYITSGREEISMDEVTEITDYIQQEARSQAEIIWGNGYDESLGDCISITLIATGFEDHHRKANKEARITHQLNSELNRKIDPLVHAFGDSLPENEQQHEPTVVKGTQEGLAHDDKGSGTVDFDKIRLMRKSDRSPQSEENTPEQEPVEDERTFMFDLNFDTQPKTEETSDMTSEGEEEPALEAAVEEPAERKPFEIYIKKPASAPAEIHGQDSDRTALDLRSKERVERLRNLSMKLTPDGINQLENQPAYMRKNVELSSAVPSAESHVSRYTLYENDDSRQVELRSSNSFLHDNVD